MSSTLTRVDEITDDATRRQFLILLGAAGLLVACGDNGGNPEASRSDVNRSVDHALGTAEAPASPTRVVSTDKSTLDAIVALGVTPVGTGVWGSAVGVPDYVAEDDPVICEQGLVAGPGLCVVSGGRPCGPRTAVVVIRRR